MFTIASKSDFLNGKNNTGWTASIDWLLKPANFVKVLEGNYVNKVAPTKANDPRASLAEGYNEPL